jgi:hypothetical protein
MDIALLRAIQWAAAQLKRISLLLILLFAACNPIRGCPESHFTLMTDSRLPRWFLLPSGYVRDDVTVELRYYVPPLSVDDVVMALVDRRHGQTLSKVTGRACWHPQIDTIKRSLQGGFERGSEPRYTIVRAAGLVEIIDHPIPGPMFRITDDPALVKEAIDSLQRGECRKE